VLRPMIPALIITQILGAFLLGFTAGRLWEKDE
jgi:hypothetical protein